MSITNNFKKEDVVGLEPMHISYCESNTGDSDALIIKEIVHLKDGSRHPNLRVIKDYKRPFWVTRKGARTHTDKLQWEHQDNLNEYECCQFELAQRAHKALGGFGQHQGLKRVLDSPYLYGANITSKALLRRRYKDRWPECVTPKANVAVYDVETDVVHGTDQIIISSLSFKKRAVSIVLRSFLGMTPGTEAHWQGRIYDRVTELLSEDFNARGINYEVVFVDTPGEAVVETLKRLHEWQPDLAAAWNMYFDIGKFIEALEADKIDPKEVFSDPRVPPEYRNFQWVPGAQFKTTHDGKQTSKNIEEKWPYVLAPNGFYFIDPMCLYAKLRFAMGKEEGYDLDGVLKRNINRTKLKFDKTDHLSKVDWHKEMQKNYKLEYIAYGLFDCIGVELLDEKTGDMASAFVPQADDTDWENFSSDPSKIADGMHFQCLSEGYVIGTCGGNIGVEDDEYVVKPRGWIVTLAAYLAQDIGLPFIKELPHKQTMTTIHNADLDIEGTYPSIQEAMNACKATTIREIVEIEGLYENQKRKFGVDLSGGVTNACALAELGFGVAGKSQLLSAFLAEHP